VLRLNSKADYRLNHGHLWVYSNEIDNSAQKLTALNAGELAIIANAAGKNLGVAYVNPNTLICARILSFDLHTPINVDFFIDKITAALTLRTMIFTPECYRLIYGESDFLPGLVVDRFFDVLVVQISTAGMEKLLDYILPALEQVIKPRAILLKNDGKMRSVEGLDSYVRWYSGSNVGFIPLIENGVKFFAPVLEGQKTGWFYDHRLMRQRLQVYAPQQRVLDVFSYIGGWGIQAAACGAKQVICNDVSELALEYVVRNAQQNNLTNVTTIQGDAFSVMEKLIDQQERFSLVILDPPAFIPRRKDVAKGKAAYQKANLLAMRLLVPGGILISGSCSMHLTTTDLLEVMYKSALKLKRQMQILEEGQQGPDHPVHPAIAETKYLKSFIARII